MKIELLFEGNESVIQLTARELQGIRRFNRFVLNVYLQSWFSCRNAADAPLNDILLIDRLYEYHDAALQTTGQSSLCIYNIVYYSIRLIA